MAEKPDYERFLRSTSKEIMAVKDRVRYLIGNANWAEEGRYKEVILSEILRSFLPERYGIGTGFAICQNDIITSQIDIIIYDKFKKENNTEILKKGNFVIVESKSVEAIIEVKSSFGSQIFEKDKKGRNAITKILENKHKIMVANSDNQYRYSESKNIFAGIFAFSRANNYQIETIHSNLKEYLQTSNIALDCISFDKNYFMKFWNDTDDIPQNRPKYKHYGLYRFKKDLSFGYFISNLLEHLKIETTGRKLSNDELKRLYPLAGGKEKTSNLGNDYEIKLENKE